LIWKQKRQANRDFRLTTVKKTDLNTMTSLDELPAKPKEQVDFNNLSSKQLEQRYVPSGKKPVGTDSFLRKNTLHLGVSKSERLASLELTPAAQWRKDRLSVQKKYRAFNPSVNSFAFASEKSGLQKGFENFKKSVGTRRYHRYYLAATPLSLTKLSIGARLQRFARSAYGKLTGATEISWLHTAYDPYIEYPSITFDAYRVPSDELLSYKYSSEPQESLTEKITHVVEETKKVVQDFMGPKIQEAQQGLGEVRERLGVTVNRLIGSDDDRREAHQ
jgi:hypothetical protein